ASSAKLERTRRRGAKLALARRVWAVAAAGAWAFGFISAVILPPAAPFDLRLASPATHKGKIDRQDKQPDRDHPEAEDRQKADQPAQNQQYAERDPHRRRARNSEPL